MAFQVGRTVRQGLGGGKELGVFRNQEEDSLAGGWGRREGGEVGWVKERGAQRPYGGAGFIQSAVGSSGER